MTAIGGIASVTTTRLAPTRILGLVAGFLILDGRHARETASRRGSPLSASAITRAQVRSLLRGRATLRIW